MGIEDYVLVALQGRLSKRRPWQYASVGEMVTTICAQDPTRMIILKPRPKEVFGSEDKAVISELLLMPNIQLLELPIEPLIARCAYIVAQNSTVAFKGLLYQKPAILFAKSDFHHIFVTVKNAQEAPAAFARIKTKSMPYKKYLYCYLRMNAVDNRRANAPAKIKELLVEAGWNIAL